MTWHPDEESYPDLEFKQAMQHELNDRLAQRLVDNAARVGRAYQMATLSAVTGRWDDVWKDIRRGKITPSHAQGIVDSLHGVRLISDSQHRAYHEKISALCPT